MFYCSGKIPGVKLLVYVVQKRDPCVFCTTTKDVTQLRELEEYGLH